MQPIKRKYTPQQITELFETRYTCKSYDPTRSVSNSDLNTLLNTIRLSPSSMGLEPWQVLVLERGELIQNLLPLCWGVHEDPSHYIFLLGRNAHHFLNPSPYLKHIHTDIQKHNSNKLESRSKKIIKFLHDDLGLNTNKEIESWVDKQVYIAMGILLTSAAMLGIDSTPVEGMNYAKLQDTLAELELLDPQDFHLSGLITLGYTNREEHRPKTRRTLDEIITYAK